MTCYRYPLKSVIGDYLRAAAGLILAGGLLLTGALPWFVALIFSVLVILFSLFALRTVKRHYLEVSLDEEGIGTLVRPGGQDTGKGHFPRYLAWQDLSAMKLRYFGSRRNHSKEGGGGGFMQLTLSGRRSGPDGGAGPKTTLSFESSIEGFPAIVSRAVRAARHLELNIDATTAGNLRPLGIELDPDAIDAPRN